jgi:ankyrin repeat protein
MTSIVELHLSQEKEEATGALCFASGAGDLEKMRSILRAHPADCSDYDNRTPLHIAASKGHVQAVNLLLGADADLNALDNFNRTPLMEALRSKRMGAADLIFSCGGSLGFDLVGTVTPAASSVGMASGKTDASPRREGPLRSRRMSISSRGSLSQSSVTFSEKEKAAVSAASELCEAASDPLQLWYLDALIRYGADVNASDYDARTALHVACASGNKGAVKLLLSQAGVNHSPTDNFGRTPLMEAVRHKHEPCARILKSHSALHGFATGSTGNDANVLHAGQELCQAAFGNDTAYLHGLVILCGLDVDTPDYDSRTALMLSCAEGYSDAALSLVQLGADIYKKDRWGHTAIEEARDHGHSGLADMLENYHAERLKAKATQTALAA